MNFILRIRSEKGETRSDDDDCTVSTERSFWTLARVRESSGVRNFILSSRTG